MKFENGDVVVAGGNLEDMMVLGYRKDGRVAVEDLRTGSMHAFTEGYLTYPKCTIEDIVQEAVEDFFYNAASDKSGDALFACFTFASEHNALAAIVEAACKEAKTL